MSKVVSFQGARGGVGTTSIVAMLGDVLSQQEQSVLMVDLAANNMLRLMFNVPYADPRGWAHSIQHEHDWRDSAFEARPNLLLLPHGRANGNVPSLEAFGAELLNEFSQVFDWILLDLPPQPELSRSPELMQRVQLAVRVLNADVGCHVRWIEAESREPSHHCYLVNRFDPSRELAAELVNEWKLHSPQKLVPILIGADESVEEAIARKSTATHKYPGSWAAANIRSLALWLTARSTRWQES